MNWGVFLLIALILGVLLFGVQRTEARRRRLALLILVGIGFLTWYWANVRGLSGEFTLAAVISLVLNVAFWLLIGRYNPVADSDETITVYGMDD